MTTRVVDTLWLERWYVCLLSSYLVVTFPQVLLVTGGIDKHNDFLSSTEVFSYPMGEAWREVGHLPSPRYGLRGATLAGNFIGNFYVTGGTNGNHIHNYTFTKNPEDFDHLDDVLAWDPVGETWAEVGQLAKATTHHAITVLPLAVFEEYCS